MSARYPTIVYTEEGMREGMQIESADLPADAKVESAGSSLRDRAQAECGQAIDEQAARAATGQKRHGAAEVDPARGTRQFHDGRWYYFDTLGCRSRFMANPGGYLEPTGGS